MKRLGLWVLAALLGGGCGKSSGTFVVVHFQAEGAPAGIRHIDLALVLGARSTTVPLELPVGKALPLTSALTIEEGEGTLTLTATAKDAGGTTLAMGMATAEVVRGDTSDAFISFGAAQLDGGLDGSTTDGGGDGGGAASLVIDPDYFEYGSVLVGQSSPALFMVSNRGTGASAPLARSLTGAASANFQVGTDMCTGQSLPAGGSCMLAVTFMPAGMGGAGALLEVSAGPGVAASATLHGTGELPGTLAIAPASKDFGPTPVSGTSAIETFTVTSSAATGMLTARLSGNDSTQFALASDGCGATALPGTGQCLITVRFQPTSGGAKTASLVVNGTPGGTAIATLSGLAQRPAHLMVTPVSHDFGSGVVGVAGSATTFTFGNDGDLPTTMLATQAPASDFEVTANTCTGTLAAGASCTIMVRLDAASSGVKMSTLSVSASEGGMASVSLSGTAARSASLSANPTDGAFGSVVTGNVSTVTFVVLNGGEIASGVPGVTLGGADMSQFSITGNTCTGALMPNASCTIQVRFTPTSAGNKVGLVTVTASPGGTLMAPLNGTGVTPGDLRIAPAMNNFMGVQMGSQSSAVTFTVTNTGGAPTGTLATALSRGAASEFAITTDTCTGMALAASATCSVGVRMAPATAGSKTDSLEVSATPGGLAAASLTGTGLAGPRLAISPPFLSYASTLVNGTTSPQLFTVTNAGDVVSGTAAVALSGANANQFALSASTCTAALAPGATCTVMVAFHPTSGGFQSASLDASASPGGSASSTVSGTGLTPTAFSVTPATYAFGSVQVGTSSATQSFTVRNTGDVASAALTTTIAAPFAVTSDGCQGMTLAANATCTVSARFSPSARGAAGGMLQVSASGASASAMLSGTGTDAILALTPSPYSFGSLLMGASATQTFTVTNTGDATSGPVTLALSGTNMADFALTGGTCTSGATTLAPGLSCTKVVSFTPAAAGARAGSLSASATPGGTASSALSGTGIAPGMLTVTPSSFDFGPVLVGTNSATQSFTVHNSGGVATGALTVTTAAPFVIVSNLCTGTLAAGGSCAITVRFSPTVQSSAGGSLAIGDGTASVSASLSGQGTMAVLAVSPGSWDYGGVLVGASSTKTIVVTNTGNATSGAVTLVMTGSSFTLLTGAAGDCVSGTTTLAGGASCNARVKFMPATRLGKIGSVAASASPGGSSSSSLSGLGQTPATLTVSPTSYAYGNVLVGSTSSPVTFTFHNTGDVATAALSTTLSTHWSVFINNCTGATLMPASANSCTVSVRFAPTTTGFKSGALTVTDGTTNATALIGGTGQAPATLGPYLTSLTFANTSIGSTTAIKTWTITNSGDVSSGVPTISFSGPNVNNFPYTNNCTAALPAGGSCTVTIAFRPTSPAGAKSAMFDVYASPGGDAQASCSGNAQ